MVKAYLNYETVASFGVIATPSVPAIPLPSSIQQVPHIVTAAVDSVLIWSIHTGEIVARFSNAAIRKSTTVSSIAVSPDGSVIAAGYADGSVRIWMVKLESSGDVLPEKEPIATFNGHRSHLTAMSFECMRNGATEKPLSNRLVTASADGDVILWDLAGENGVFRVPAHNDVVTSVLLLKQETRDIIVSSSKDGLVRVYDVSTQHCLQTVVGHRAEVWAMALDPTHSLLITGSVDAEVRVFRFMQEQSTSDASKDDTLDVLEPLGSVQRKSAVARVGAIHCEYSRGEMFAIVTGIGKTAELFRIRSAKDANSHKQRRKKRFAEKQEQRKAQEQFEMDEETPTFIDALEAKDFLVSVRLIKTAAKIRGAKILSGSYVLSYKKTTTLDVRILLQPVDNSLELYRVVVSKQKKLSKRKRGDLTHDNEEDNGDVVGAVEKIRFIDRSGHRGDVRSISLSPDDRLLLSASKKSLKLWNIATSTCIRSMLPSGFGLCSTFLGADGSFGAIGTKEGSLEVFNLGSGSHVVKIEKAHDNAIWSMALESHIYDADVLITGGADKKICFWKIDELIKEGDGKIKPHRTLQMPDEVLCVCITKNRQRPILLASLMDATVRAVFMDTLEPAMNFYGHKLPVMSMDVSSDGLILATGSADKTVKLWGIDFGDCRRSLRAHDDSVVSLAFQPKTHYLFSGSRDGTLKYWDGDKFVFISELPGQRGEVWSVAVSDDGEMVASASHDKMLRVWRRTDEPLFLQEEEDRRMDEMFESTIVDEDVREARKERSSKIDFLDDGSAGEALRAGKVSLDTIKGGEKLLEALELCDEEISRQMQEEQDDPNPLLLGMKPGAYLLRTLEQIRTADLEEVMHVLPLKNAMSLLRYVCDLLKPGLAKQRLSIEVLIRTAVQLIKLHQNQVIAGACDRATIAVLHEHMKKQMEELRKRFGFNNAALGFWSIQLAEERNAAFRDASSRAYNLNAKRRKSAGVAAN